MNQHHLLRTLFLALLFVIPAQATIVRMDIAIGGDQPPQEVYIELFDQQTPVTVANFLNYIENSNLERRYDGTFFHRSVPGFIVQGGGYLYDPATGPFDTSIPHISTDAPIINEFDPSRSNLRGTIAMAKLAGDPDSATSEWFINTADNSANLDNQNGGFTVFGRVLGQDMSVIDTIAGLSVENQGGVFQELPTTRDFSGSPPTTADLVILNRVEVIATAKSRPDTYEIDFGIVQPGAISAPVTLTIQNVGGTDLVIDSISNPFLSSTIFFIVRDTCTGIPLPEAAICEVDFEFRPNTSGETSFQTFVLSNDPTSADQALVLRGTGANDTPTLSTDVSSLDLGTLTVSGASAVKTITVQNTGNGNLLPSSTSITGTDASDFSLTDNCTGSTLPLAAACTLDVTFNPNSTGQKTAVLTVTADPGGQSIDIDLSGNVITSSPALVLPDPDIIDFGDIFYLEQKTLSFELQNGGGATLDISSLSLTGTDSGLFSLDPGDCSQITVSQGSCSGSVTFTPSVAGTTSATLEIRTNDPLTPLARLTLTASAGQDRDGVPDATEDASPNTGDGNNDGIPDSLQDNVASLKDINGNYVSLESDAGTRLSNVATSANPAPESSPTADGNPLDFPLGFFSFFIEDVTPGDPVKLVLHLQETRGASTYFKYSPISGRWSTFDYDPVTQTGARFDSNRVTLYFVDGGRGDADFFANGRIIDPGGPAILPGTSGSSGGGCALDADQNRSRNLPVDFILMLAVLLVSGLYRNATHRYRG